MQMPAVTSAAPPVALLGLGVVRHRRLRPRPHAFAYPTYFVMLPLRALRAAPLAALRRNRFGWLSFHDRDHGDGRVDALAWLDDMLTTYAVFDGTEPRGEVWLHCYPRVLGYVFKPVSFWYCHRADGALAAIVAEVNNTFGERHCYLLAGPEVAFGKELVARKVFHVSPFCAVQGRYRFRFMRTADRTVARIDHDDEDIGAGPLLQTSVSGHLQPLTAGSIRSAFFGTPLMTLGVMLRIHWHALQLWAKRVPFFSKPAPPQAFISR
ncbi:MAG: DUF1365 domain-containing protein [Chitinophagaceae bacterium]|nr:DUF1365 domain-containing protein [Rubrivivax sp.]